jgi:hypothetical protein
MKRIVGILFTFLSFSALADCACNSGTSTTYSSPSYQMAPIAGCSCNRNRIPENAYSSPYSSSPYYFGSGGCVYPVRPFPPCRNPNGEDFGGYFSSNVTVDQNNVVLYMGY